MHVVPVKYAQYTFYFLMALLMSGLMSLVVTTINIGLVTGLIQAWLNAWIVGFLAALPTIMIVTPAVKKIVNQLVVESD